MKMRVMDQMVKNRIRVRPVDKRENFIKRCIGMPGEDLQIIDQKVFINGSELPNPIESQQTYAVHIRSLLLISASINSTSILPFDRS